MLPPPFQSALVLTGPTGSGKTELGIELARQLNAEIVAMDSMTVYRGLDIGTAKPTLEQRRQVHHHLIDVLDPWESASVAWWLEQARTCCREIESRGKQVLFIGGTPLYLKALCCGLFEGPAANEAIRQRLVAEAHCHGSTHLHERLQVIDRDSALRIHPNDVRRLVRALEVFELTGQPMSAWQTQWVDEKLDAAQRKPGASINHNLAVPGSEGSPSRTASVLWLDLPRQALYDRIDRRVEVMFASGWMEEVKRLRNLKHALSREARMALGYKEVNDLLDGAITPEEAISQVQARTRNFAKRQMTWYRHLDGCRPVSKELTWQLWQAKMKR